MKRAPRPGPRPARPRDEPQPAAPLERHSGEGSASALEILQKLEDRRRQAAAPGEPREPEEGDRH